MMPPRVIDTDRPPSLGDGASVFETNRLPDFRPFLSICIPQYNRTSFLIQVCKSIAEQNFSDIEICISDDCSTDGRQVEILEYLRSTGRVFTYSQTRTNVRYDANLRNSIALSAGRYLLLLGNDDRLIDAGTLTAIHQVLIRNQPVAAAMTNYEDSTTRRVFRRMRKHELLKGGPGTAVSIFRSYGFVSGVILEGDGARSAATEAVDGSEMYQMYLGTRLIARGGTFLAIERVCVEKDIRIRGEMVDSYRSREIFDRGAIVERVLPLGRILGVVAAGLEPFHHGRVRERNLASVARQLYCFTYPYWIVEYRRVQSWRYSAGVFLALRPSRIAKGLNISVLPCLQLWLLYLACGALALSMPLRIFDLLQPLLYTLAKRLGSRLAQNAL